MLVHCSGLDNAAALALVGHYHASRIMPLLFLSVADLLAGAVMPYLSHDWESGARERVSERLNMVLKVTSLVMLAGGVVVLWTAPLLFHLAFGDRYDEGLAVMPWTLTYCVWYSLLLVAQNYVWCAEKAKLAVLPLVGGLLVNIGIDLLLIPAWGLLGAVVATTIATGVALGAIYWINHRAGMQFDRGMLWFRSRRSRCAAACGSAPRRYCCSSRAAVFENARHGKRTCADRRICEHEPRTFQRVLVSADQNHGAEPCCLNQLLKPSRLLDQATRLANAQYQLRSTEYKRPPEHEPLLPIRNPQPAIRNPPPRRCA